MKIPSNKQWTQDNSGDVLGILGDTTNMAMDTNGKAILARKSVWIAGTQQDNGFGYPIAINYFDDRYVVLTDDDIGTFNLPNPTFDDALWAPSGGLYSDAVIFNSLYTVSTSTSIYTWDGGTLSGDWDDRSASLTASINHPLEVFGVLLACGNGNTVKLFNTSYTLTQTLTLPTEHRVVTMRAVGNYLYIGTKNLNGGNAKIYVWNGDSTLFDYECEVGASWVFSMTPYLSTVAAVTSQGQLGIVNGTTFEELAGLPVYHDPHARWTGGTGLTLNGKVFNRGMCTIGSTIYLNIDGDVDSGFIPEMKSGIWVYDPDIGLYHRGTGSEDLMVSDNSLTRSGDTLTTSAPHKLKTGDAVCFDTIFALTGVTAETTYYVTVVSPTQIKLSQSRKGVQNQNYITLGGTPTSDDLIYCENNDFGLRDVTSGAIAPTVYSETPHPNMTSEILWGSRFAFQDGTADEYGIFSFADSWNVGSFTTQRVYTDNIDQNWKELYNFIDGLTVDTEEVVVKIQTNYEPPSDQLNGVWLNSNTLNNSSANDFSAWSDIEVGYEIVVIDGYGRGRTAHVTEVNTSSSTVSLVLDEDIGTINGACDVYYTTFKKVGQNLTVNNKTKEKVKSVIENVVSPWIAVKIELRGYGLAVNMMEMSNVINKGTQ